MMDGSDGCEENTAAGEANAKPPVWSLTLPVRRLGPGD